MSCIFWIHTSSSTSTMASASGISIHCTMYLHHGILYLHHVTKELFNSELFICIFLHNEPLHNSHRPQTGPGQFRHLFQTVGGQQPRHHSHHLSFHRTTHLCHCFCLSHQHPYHNDHCNHLLHHSTGYGAQQSNIIIHQHQTLNAQHTTIHIQQLHPSVAAQYLAQQSGIIFESLLDFHQLCHLQVEWGIQR